VSTQAQVAFEDMLGCPPGSGWFTPEGMDCPARGSMQISFSSSPTARTCSAPILEAIDQVTQHIDLAVGVLRAFVRIGNAQCIRKEMHGRFQAENFDARAKSACSNAHAAARDPARVSESAGPSFGQMNKRPVSCKVILKPGEMSGQTHSDLALANSIRAATAATIAPVNELQLRL
jgi:hypothetical protein